MTRSPLRILLLLFALAAARPTFSQPPPFSATPILSGTFKYPNGGLVNGRLLVKLEKNGLLNTCTTPSVIAPTTTVTIQVVNGALQGTPAFVPTDCLSAFQPYLAELRDGKNQSLFKNHWFMTPAGGGAMAPSAGTAWISDAGLNLVTGTTGGQAVSSPLVFVAAYPSGYQKATALTGTMSATTAKTITVTWPTPFGSPPGTVVCDVLETSVPMSSNMSVASVSGVTISGASVTVTNNSASSLSGKVVCRAR